MADSVPTQCQGVEPADAAAITIRRRIARGIVIGVPLVLAAVVLLLLVRSVARDAVNLPIVDEWTFAREVVRARDGQLTLADLWVQHNEHRIPVAKLLLHLLAWPTRWDVRWAIATNVVIAVVAILVTAWIIVRTVRPVAPMAVGILVLVTTAVQCSLAQWQNWTWGWQAGLFVTEAAGPLVAATLVRASAPGASSATWAVVAVAAALVAAFSNGAGLVLLVLVPVAFLVLRGSGARVSAVTVLACFAIAVVVVIVYSIGWQPGLGGQPRPTPIRAHEAALADYVVTLLGSRIVASDPGTAWRWGVAAVICLLACVLVVWIREPSRRVSILPWAVLGAYSLGAAALIAVGRLGAGEHTALLSRYSTYAVPLWLAVGPAIVIASSVVRRRPIRLAIQGAALLVLGWAGSHWGLAWRLGDEEMARRAAKARFAANCIVDPETAPDRCYLLVCWDASVARRAAVALRAHRLGPWASTGRAADNSFVPGGAGPDGGGHPGRSQLAAIDRLD